MARFSTSSTRRTRRGAMRRPMPLQDQQDVYQKHLEEQVVEGNSALGKATSRAKKLRDCLSAVAEKVCDSEYGDMQLGGPNQIAKYSDTELRDFIINNYYSQKSEMTKTIHQLQTLYTQTKSERDDISKQLIQTRQKLKEAEARISNLEYEIQHSSFSAPSEPSEKAVNLDETDVPEISLNDFADTPDDFDFPEPPEPDFDNEPTATSVASNDDSIVVMDGEPYDLNDVRKTMDILQNTLLKVLGEKGFNETNDILEYAVSLNEFSSRTQATTTLGKLKESHIVQTQKHPVLSNGMLWSLTDLGKAMFKKLYQKNPCLDEMSRVIKMHDNIDHGYLIKYTAKALEAGGHENVCMDSKVNRIDIGNGLSYTPDITADFQGRKTFWEVERGNHHDQEFFKKMDKAALTTGGEIRIVVDKNTTKAHVLSQANKYAEMKRKSKTNLTIVVGTLTELKSGRFLRLQDNRITVGSKH